MLHHRLLLGTLFVAGLAVLCWADGQQWLAAPPGAWLFPMALLLSVLASGEMLWLFAARDLKPLPWAVYVGNLLIVGANAVPMFWPNLAAGFSLGQFGWPFCAVAVALLVTFLGEMRRYEQPGQVMVNLALAVLCFGYVGVLLTFAVQLRVFGTNAQGMLALASLVVVVKMGDTGAFTVGRLIGRHKMAPVLSPGKTWEGFGGAILFAVVGSWIVFNVAAPWLSSQMVTTSLEPWRVLAYGAIVGIAGLLGDLAESLIKRDMGRKDSSPWMPGFGGVLDILDSVLFAAPVACLCWAFGLVD